MLGVRVDSRLIDVALGLVLVFAVVASLSAVTTEFIARFLGLRARFLLLGLRELLDGRGVTTVRLVQARSAAEKFQQAVRAVAAPDSPAEALAVPVAAAAGPAVAQPAPPEAQPAPPEAQPAPPEVRSATAAMLGTTVLRTQGIPGSVTTRLLEITKSRDASFPKVRLVRCDREQPMYRSDTWPDWLRWSLRNPLWRMPSYISSSSFSTAVFDLLVPADGDRTDLAQMRHTLARLEGYPTFTSQLSSLLKAHGDDVETFRAALERWYDDHMDRVSGWYKRHISIYALVIGAVLVLVLNVNSLAIARTLYTDDAVRAAVASVAVEAADCPESADSAECLAQVQQEIAQAQDAGLPLGWPVVAACRTGGAACDWFAERGLVRADAGWLDWQPALALLGWAITVLALVPGARFWFDLLGRFGSLRTTGPRPAAAARVTGGSLT